MNYNNHVQRADITNHLNQDTFSDPNKINDIFIDIVHQSKGIDIMNRARNYLTKNSLRKLYLAYIYSYLIYYIEIWGIYISPNSLKTSTSTAEETHNNHDFLQILCSYRSFV